MKQLKRIFSILIFCTIFTTYSQFNHETHIAVVGTGYVGLVTGVGLAEFGNHVICADIDKEKIACLRQYDIPIYEPGLQKLVKKNVEAQLLTFTYDTDLAIQLADIIFIAVGTPMADDGSADLSALKAVLHTIAKNLTSYKTIVTKSTVPIGTGKWIRSFFEHELHIAPDSFSLVSNPEFLREGSAVKDFLHPDRIVIGAQSKKAFDTMRFVYDKLLQKEVPIIETNIITAETIKYASNAFLATKLSFINEMANLCDATGADILDVAHAMGMDKRISKYFLQPGPGFGGSCFPKDTNALVSIARDHNLNLLTVQSAIASNEIQQRKPIEKLTKILSTDLTDKTIAILGVAFKANTDDIRHACSIRIIENLLHLGAHIKVYDPAAMNNMKKIFSTIEYCDSLYEALSNADAALILTEWDEFKSLDIEKAGELMSQKIIIDARNILDAHTLTNAGFICDNIGRSYLCKTL